MDICPKYLWSLYYYDGPIDGIAELNGEKMYFNTKDDGGWRSYEPTADEIVAIERELSGEGPEVDGIYCDDDGDKRTYCTCEDRIFNLYKLPHKIYKTMQTDHQKFLKMVTGPDATEETRKEFYKAHKNGPLDISKLEFVGIFIHFDVW